MTVLRYIGTDPEHYIPGVPAANFDCADDEAAKGLVASGLYEAADGSILPPQPPEPEQEPEAPPVDTDPYLTAALRERLAPYERDNPPTVTTPTSARKAKADAAPVESAPEV